jgi:hypothetical protein
VGTETTTIADQTATGRKVNTLAFYGVKAGCRRKEIETVSLGVAGDDSRGAAGNFDDIGVGHESFLPLSSVKSKYSQVPFAVDVEIGLRQSPAG